jgi:3-phenylpropionate/trans-cinnamate dioxygenase ferredoxin reductase subunit
VVCLREEGFGGDLVLIGAEPEVPYDKVLIATGRRNRRPPIAGLDLEGVYDLRTVIDADRVRSQVVPGRKVVIAGMGFIGSEVAASLRMLGMEESVIARLQVIAPPSSTQLATLTFQMHLPTPLSGSFRLHTKCA